MDWALKVTYEEFMRRAKQAGLTVRHDGDYALRLYYDNKLIVTVIKIMKARLVKDNYHQLPQHLKEEVHTITDRLDRDTLTNTEQMELF